MRQVFVMLYLENHEHDNAAWRCPLDSNERFSSRNSIRKPPASWAGRRGKSKEEWYRNYRGMMPSTMANSMQAMEKPQTHRKLVLM